MELTDEERLMMIRRVHDLINPDKGEYSRHRMIEYVDRIMWGWHYSTPNRDRELGLVSLYDIEKRLRNE